MDTSFDVSQLEELINAIHLVRLTNYGIVCCCTFLCYDIALNAALEVNRALFVMRLLVLTICTGKLYLEHKMVLPKDCIHVSSILWPGVPRRFVCSQHKGIPFG
ncbi:hypothetical protein AX14_014286 [Amanita brunnescens Koide BX004]|nr:hypothetical protein AX14_014286 [Amanita brunnescens Koide BX004]